MSRGRRPVQAAQNDLPEGRQWFRIPDAVRLTGLGDHIIRQRCAAGTFRHMRRWGRIYVHRSAIVAALSDAVPAGEEYYSPRQFSDLMVQAVRIGESAVLHRCWRGQLKCVKQGTRYYIPRSELLRVNSQAAGVADSSDAVRPDEECYSPQQFADLMDPDFRPGVAAIVRQCRQGELKSVKRSGRYYIPSSELRRVNDEIEALFGPPISVQASQEAEEGGEPLAVPAGSGSSRSSPADPPGRCSGC